MYCIYRITNLINRKTYIGQHKYTDETNPMGKYKGSGKLLWLAYKKYGFESFETEILYARIRDKETVDAMEIWAIAKYKPEYNIAVGGQGGDTYSGLPRERYDIVCQKLRQHRHTEETKQKLRQYDRSYLQTEEIISKRTKTFKQNHHHSWNSGKTMSEEWKKAHPSGALGHTWSCKGCKRNPEQIERNRQAQKEYWSKHEHTKGSKGMKWYNNGSEQILCLPNDKPLGYVEGNLSNKGKPSWNSGKKMSKEYCENNRKAQKEHASRADYVNPATGRHWYTNGITNVFTYECPTGYKPGVTRS